MRQGRSAYNLFYDADFGAAVLSRTAVSVGGAHAFGFDLFGRHAVAAQIFADSVRAAFAQTAVVVGASSRVGVGADLYIIACVGGFAGKVVESRVFVDVGVVVAEEVDHPCRGVVDAADRTTFRCVFRYA